MLNKGKLFAEGVQIDLCKQMRFGFVIQRACVCFPFTYSRKYNVGLKPWEQEWQAKLQSDPLKLIN